VYFEHLLCAISAPALAPPAFDHISLLNSKPAKICLKKFAKLRKNIMLVANTL
jgi:hypothetical protein